MVRRAAALLSHLRPTKESAMMVLRPAAMLKICRVHWEPRLGYPGRHARNRSSGFKYLTSYREKFSYKRLFNLIRGTVGRRSYRARIQLSDLAIEVGGLEELGAGGQPYGTSLQTRPRDTKWGPAL